MTILGLMDCIASDFNRVSQQKVGTAAVKQSLGDMHKNVCVEIAKDY